MYSVNLYILDLIYAKVFNKAVTNLTDPLIRMLRKYIIAAIYIIIYRLIHENTRYIFFLATNYMQSHLVDSH